VALATQKITIAETTPSDDYTTEGRGLRFPSDRNDRYRCRPRCLLRDAAEEDSIRPTSPSGPHHDGVNVIRVDAFEDFLRRITVFDVRDVVPDTIRVCLRYQVIDSVGRGLFTVRFRGC
jgi:hypothetical protein